MNKNIAKSFRGSTSLTHTVSLQLRCFQSSEVMCQSCILMRFVDLNFRLTIGAIQRLENI